MKNFLQTPEWQAVEHMLKIAVFYGISAFLTELITLLSNNPLITHNNLVALVFIGYVNVILAGLKKYFDLKKAEPTSATPTSTVKPGETTPAAEPQT